MTVSRPLFIEEHGLRMYLDQEGVGIELSRTSYESGEWAKTVEEAYCKGWDMKETKRRKEYDVCVRWKRMDRAAAAAGDDEARLSERERQGREMARGVVEWVDNVREVMMMRQKREADVDNARDIVTVLVPLVPVLPLEPVEAKGILVA
jgi:hypothetical protein